MLLPMSLYMGASLSYDAALLACYYLMLALLTCPEWDSRTAAVYGRLRVCQRHQAPTSTCCGWCCRWWSCAERVESQTQPRVVTVGTLAGAC